MKSFTFTAFQGRPRKLKINNKIKKKVIKKHENLGFYYFHAWKITSNVTSKVKSKIENSINQTMHSYFFCSSLSSSSSCKHFKLSKHKKRTENAFERSKIFCYFSLKTVVLYFTVIILNRCWCCWIPFFMSNDKRARNHCLITRKNVRLMKNLKNGQIYRRMERMNEFCDEAFC